MSNNTYEEHKTCSFCHERSCSCHENSEKINDLYEAYQDGFVTEEERDNIYSGRNV